MNEKERKMLDIAFENAIQAHLFTQALVDLLTPEQKKQFNILLEKHVVILAESIKPPLGDGHLQVIYERVLESYRKI